MNQEQLISLAETIRQDYPSQAKDFVDAFEWLRLAIDGVLTKVGNDLQGIHQSGQYKKLAILGDFSEELENLQQAVVGYASHFSSPESEESELEEEVVGEQEIAELEQKQLPDYSKYVLNESIPHALYEDYSHTKSCGFSLLGKRYDAKNMRDVLVQTCAILASTNPDKMRSFLDDPLMKGRKVSYFVSHSVTEEGICKTEHIPGTEWYVWVNQSCNSIRNMIKRMLKKYDIPFSDFKIYLRADYKALHQAGHKGVD